MTGSVLAATHVGPGTLSDSISEGEGCNTLAGIPTRLGQNKLMFWIETKPTKRETGNNQNKVNPLGFHINLQQANAG